MTPDERQRAIDAGRAIRKALSTADFPYKSLTRACVEARELAGFLDAVNALLVRVNVAHDFSDILTDWADDRWQESRAVMMCVVLSK